VWDLARDGAIDWGRSKRPHPPRAEPRGDLPLKGGGREVVIFCRGFAPDDPWFGGIRFNAAKGEMLTVRVSGLHETRTVHRGIWLSPLGDERFRVGATYTWEPLDSIPTSEGRSEIESKLRAFLKLPFEVLDHRAAVRPVIDAGYPVLGRHPRHPRRAYFNGLGSKGSLLAPFFANQLAMHLCGEGDIEEAVNVARFLVHAPPATG
jgi:glycine oxidase